MSTGTRILTGHETSLYIDGSWSAPSDGRLVDVINPTTEEAIGQPQWPVRRTSTAPPERPGRPSTAVRGRPRLRPSAPR